MDNLSAQGQKVIARGKQAFSQFTPKLKSLLTREEVKRIRSMPRSSRLAPHPFVVSDNHTLVVAYALHQATGTPALPPEDRNDTGVVIVRDYVAYQFGPSYDAALTGHRLGQKGLMPHGVFAIKHSQWLAQVRDALRLERPPESFAMYKHFIFCFQHTPLEVIASKFEITVLTVQGNRTLLLERMARYLQRTSLPAENAAAGPVGQ